MRLKKRLILICFLAVAGLIISTQMAAAGYTVTTTGGSGGYGPYQTGLGGEFTLLPNNDLNWVLGNYHDNAKSGPAFQTFCLEVNEHIYGNTVYSATLSNAAIKGGVGSEDPVSIGTARLYYEFAKGSLSGYTYANSTARSDSAAALQQTIWWLEGELNPQPSNIFTTYILGIYGTPDIAMANNSLYPVMALNLWAENHLGDENYLMQSQLVVTPVPATVWLLGAGLVGLVGVRRRFSK